MCGEKGFVSGWTDGPKGSPPHVRGKVGVGVLGVSIVGITPACAGKSENQL